MKNTKTNNLYTREQWAKDGTFKAEAGQEISEEIYEQMLNCMPPEDLPKGMAKYALFALDIPVHSGFLMGEPYTTDEDGTPLYLAFGMNDFGRSTNHKEPRYYYLGLSAKPPELHGDYYLFDSLDADFYDKYFKVSEFESNADAIRTAADYEATLYRYTYEHGERTKKAVLYSPY